MKRSNAMKGIVLMLVLLVCGISVSHAQVAVIVNKGVGVSTLNTTELTDIYTLATKEWKSGGKINVFDLKVDAVKDKFYGHIGKTSTDLRKAWMRVQLSGEGKAPEGLNSDDEVVDRVGATTGAIGFVSADKVKGNVKVVATIQ
jgi:ABC-type phosphate transport system substrate-binding protein